MERVVVAFDNNISLGIISKIKKRRKEKKTENLNTDFYDFLYILNISHEFLFIT